MKIKNKFKYILMAVFALVIFLITSFIGGGLALSYADTSSDKVYTNVLDDLQIDDSFIPDNYPESTNDYSLQVIQIAESLDNELFIYVYQPSGQTKQLTACSINISRTINDDISFHNYKLQLLNSSGVFFKYLVNDLTVSTTSTRYYVISSIYRPFDETIDTGADYDNTITEVNFAVSKQYCFSTINGNPYVNVVDIETIEITDKFVGLVRYSDGHNWWGCAWPYTDSHFVAFNTDRSIDRLLEADVYFTKQSYKNGLQTNYVETFGEVSDEYVYLKYTDVVTHTGNASGAATYKWNRIETVEQFISENDLTQNVYSGALFNISVANKITAEGKAALQGMQWVLRFVETEYQYTTSGNAASGNWNFNTSSTLVGDVTILRLKFETDGIVYNLGVIDNKQTGSGKPINDEQSKLDFILGGCGSVNWKLVLGLFLLMIACAVCMPILAPIIELVIKGLLNLIALPFKLIASLFKRKKE